MWTACPSRLASATNGRMSGILISPSVFHIVISFELEEGAGFEPARRRRLVPLRTGCPTSWASPPVKWRRGRDSNSRGRWPRRVSSALDSLLVLSSPWSGKRPSLASAGWPPLEEFNLRLSVRTGASCALDQAGRWSPREDFNPHYRVRSPAVCALAYEGNGRRPRNRAATSSFGGSCDLRFTRRRLAGALGL